MSWSVDDSQKITMTKGDTPTFTVQCNYKDVNTGELKTYNPKENDVFVFAVKRKSSDTTPLFTKRVNNATMEVRFVEEDTKYLELGRYIWEISLNTLFGGYDEEGNYIPNENDYHCTFIDQKVLVLTDEVY